MSEKKVCIACQKTDDDQMYHVDGEDVYIHGKCLTKEWADKLGIEIEGDAAPIAPPAPQAQVTYGRIMLRILGFVLMAAAALGGIGIQAEASIVPIHSSILFATIWLTGLAMVLR